MENKKKFIAYVDWWETFKQMDDKTLADITRLIFRYVNDEHPENDLPDGSILKIIFSSFKTTLDRDLDKYKNICKRNAENGKKGGRPKTQENPKNPNGLFGNPKKPKKADIDIDSDIDIDIDSECINTHKRTPTREEIALYAQINGFNYVDINKFYSHYTAIGWKNIDDWQAALESWNCSDRKEVELNQMRTGKTNVNNPKWLNDKINNINNDGVDDL